MYTFVCVYVCVHDTYTQRNIILEGKSEEKAPFVDLSNQILYTWYICFPALFIRLSDFHPSFIRTYLQLLMTYEEENSRRVG